MLVTREVIRFPGTLAGFAEGSGSLQRLIDARQLQGALRYTVELVFEEVVSNIVRHGSPSGDVEVAIAFDGNQVVLTFEDDGVPFNPCAQPDPPAPSSSDEAQPGGFGIVLVKARTGRIDYERTPQHRNRLTLTLTPPAR